MIERIDGECFTTVPPTPLLATCIGAAERLLREALTAAVPDAVVESFRTWSFTNATQLTPAVTARRGKPGEDGSHIPELIVEFRTESTARYILGPKRMAYARHGVPEFWFADLTRQRIAVLTPGDGGEYGWPPVITGPAARLVPAGFPGAEVQAGALLGAWPAGRVREPADDEAWYET